MRKVGIIAVAAILIGLGGMVLWLRRDKPPTSEAQKPVVAATATSPQVPLPAAVSPPAVEVKRTAPSFDVVRINPQGGTVIAGKSEPGAQVTILDGDRTVGQATADERGDWVFLTDKPMPPGNRELSLTSRSARDGIVARSEGTVALMVPDAGKRSVEGEGTVAVLVPRQADAPARPLQILAGVSPVMPVSAGSGRPGGRGREVLLDAVEYDRAGAIVFSGHAAPQAKVALYVEGFAIGTAQADQEGRWSVRPAKPFKVGHYRLRMDDIAADGKVLARSGLIFARDEVPEGGLASGRQMIQPRNNLWRLARDSYGIGTRYTDIYSANRSQIEDPNLIYPGQIIGVPATR